MLKYDPEKYIVCPYCGGSAIMTNLKTGEKVVCPRCAGRKVIKRMRVIEREEMERQLKAWNDERDFGTGG